MKDITKIIVGVISFCALLFIIDWVVGTWSERMYYI